MASSSAPSHRPTSPVEEDLQKLYSEVWAVFGDEAPASERDLENIYSGYADDNDTAPSPSAAQQPYSRRTPSPYRVDTENIAPASSGKSPTRRRLPPTPASPTAAYLMPDAEPYLPPGASRPRPPVTYSSFASSSSNGYYPDDPPAPALPPKPSAYQTSSYDQQYRPTSHQTLPSRPNQYLPPKAPTPPPPPQAPPPQVPVYVEANQYLPQTTYSVTSPTESSPYATLGSEYHLRNSSYVEPPQRPASNYQPQEEDDWDPNVYAYQEEAHPGVERRPTDILKTLGDPDASHGPLDLHSEPVDDYWEDEEDEDETRFVNFALLSHIAMQLRDKVPRGTHVKGSVPYPRAFTGKDIVSTIQSQIQRELAINHGVSTNDRRVALQVARSLQSQLFFFEVEWGGKLLQDGVEEVYTFLDDQEGGSDMVPEREELPTGVITMLTRCYSPSCGEGVTCYSYMCPRKGNFTHALPAAQPEAPALEKEEDWSATIDKEVLKTIPQSEVNRQTIIHKLITREKQYLADLDVVETVFIKPLRAANPPVLPSNILEDFIDDVFGNILDLRETNRRLLEVMYVRQREEHPVIVRIGDIFLQAASDFRFAYPTYIGHYPVSEKRLKEEMDSNSNFRIFLEQCSRQHSRDGETVKLDLKHFLNRPSEHLQKYPVLLEAVFKETDDENYDKEFLSEAIQAIKNLQLVSQLRTFQSAMGKGTPGKWEWHDIVPVEIRDTFTKKEAKRQAIIFELIKGEMAYVKDLENIGNMYITPLRKAEPPIIPRDRLDQFIEDVYHNYAELYAHHKKLVDALHEIQREQHPHIRSITAALFDAALHFRDAYMEYIPNYPIAAYRIDDEMATNLPFKTFVDQCVRHPDAHRLDMKSFINRPIPRLLRYELLLKGIMDETLEGSEDLESIPNVIEVIKSLGKETEPGVQSAKQKVEVWRYNANLVSKGGEAVDLDLLNEHRFLIHSGKLLRQPESGLEWNGWSELHVLLFDNYLVMTKPKEKDGVTKYTVNRRPIPLDLLTLVGFNDPPTQRSTGILRNLRGERHEGGNTPGLSPENANDSRSVYPLTLHHNGRTGGPYILYAESAQSRLDWKAKLEDALALRTAVQESNKVFEIEYLSRDTFVMPSMAVTTGPAWNQDNQFTGKVTCSVPFSEVILRGFNRLVLIAYLDTPDGRALVAIGCTEGVWIGFRHDPKSIRRVLHLKMVTQCAMLEDFGIFLVLADKALFAYHIEALVPSSPHGAHTSQVPQKLSGTKDVHFFSVGTLQGRTLIIYMKKKSLNSIFRVLEPVGDKINEGAKAPAGLSSRLGFRSAKSEWFRIYRDFFLPSDSFDVIFLKARIAIFCAKGFEIMNLHDFESITIPQREDPKHAQLAKRCESARPLGMFRSSEEEFLLCYDEFGLYVDKHGDPCRTMGTIEWEGTAERVAFHAPYILLFDSRFIEVRHVETGRLAQIIPGNEIRCTWDGRGVSTQTPAVPIDEDGNQEAQVHFVMNSTDGSGAMRTRNIVQHVCELIPTVLISAQGTNGTSASARVPPPPSRPSDGSQRSYAPALAHMSTDSYASSGSASTSQYYVPQGGAQPYAASPMSASSSQFYPAGAAQPYTSTSSPSTTHSYSPSALPQSYSFAPTPGTPYSQPVPGGNPYYGNRGALLPGSAPHSAELRSTHSWRS